MSAAVISHPAGGRHTAMRDRIFVLPLALLLLAGAAPRPADPDPEPPEDAPREGLYRMDWGGGGYEVALTRAGRFEARQGGVTWLGVWRWDAGSRVLTVRESAPGAAEFTWRAALAPGGLAGEVRGRGAFSLRRGR
jgi:hypothetical protein